MLFQDTHFAPSAAVYAVALVLAERSVCFLVADSTGGFYAHADCMAEVSREECGITGYLGSIDVVPGDKTQMGDP